jgi:FMN phosphatase YigB (HAD superfamily)
MDERFSGIKAVGFDLDQTLYADLPEIKQAVRGEIYRLVAERTNVPLAQAQGRFEAAYAEHKSGGPALRSCGVADPREAMRDCLDRANVAGLLKTDTKLVRMLQNLGNTYAMCIITDSRRENAHKKLAALGVSPVLFDFGVYWDTSTARKETGDAYREAERHFGYAASQFAFVGNSEGDDILPASKRGWRTVHVSDKPSSHATAGINTIYDLEGLLL